MTSDQTPNPDSTSTPQNTQPEDPKTVEAKVVESTTESPKAASTPKATKTPKKTPPKATASSQSEPDAMDQAKAVAAELWRQAKPVLQKVGTQALILGNRGTDFLLDKAFPTAKDKVIEVLPADFKSQAQEKIDPVKDKVVPIWQKVWPWLKKTVGPLWAKVINFFRGKLPQDLSSQLSDRFLNILFVTAIYLVWSFFSGLTHPSQAKTPPTSDLTFPEVKNKPSMTAPERVKVNPSAAKPPQASTPPITPKPAAAPTPKIEPKPVVTPPKPSASEENKAITPKASQPASTANTAPAPTAIKETPKAAPKPIEPIKKVEPVKKPEPITTTPTPPEPKTTAPVKPVQPVKPIETGPDLVAIKSDLVDSVERVVENASAMIGNVNVEQKQLKVELSDRWYQLTEEKQAKLAQSLYSKSQRLDYERLDIRDASGNRIARSPYVGNDMIILKRSQPTSPSASSTPTKTAPRPTPAT